MKNLKLLAHLRIQPDENGLYPDEVADRLVDAGLAEHVKKVRSQKGRERSESLFHKEAESR